MRARYPDQEGFVEREGVKIFVTAQDSSPHVRRGIKHLNSYS